MSLIDKNNWRIFLGQFSFTTSYTRGGEAVRKVGGGGGGGTEAGGRDERGGSVCLTKSTPVNCKECAS